MVLTASRTSVGVGNRAQRLFLAWRHLCHQFFISMCTTVTIIYDTQPKMFGVYFRILEASE